MPTDRSVLSPAAADAALRSAQHEAQRMADRMRAVTLAAAGVLGARSVQALQEVLREACARVIPFDSFFFALYDARLGTFSYPGCYDAGVYIPPATVPAAGTPGERVVREGQPLLTLAADDPAGSGAALLGTGQRSESVIRCPVGTGTPALGLISVHSYTRGLYTPQDVEVLQALGALAATALRNIQLLEELAETATTLRESEARYRRFFNEDLAGHFVSTPEGRMLACNPAFVQMFGFASEAEVLACPGESFYPDAETRARFLERLRRERRLHGQEYELRRRDGSPIHVLEHVVGTFSEAGELLEIRGYLVDITERRLAEQALRRQAVLFETLHDAVILLDPEYRVTDWNPAAERLFGYTRAEMLGHRPLRFHDPALGGSREAEIQAVLARDGRWRGEVPFLRPDGRRGVAEAVVVLQCDEQGRPVGIVGVNRDISERIAAERERARLLALEQAARAAAEQAEQRARFLAEASELFSSSLDYETTLHAFSRLLVPRLAESCIIYLLSERGEVQRLEPAHADPGHEALLRQRLHDTPPRRDLLIPPVARVLESGQAEVVPVVEPALLRALPTDVAHTSIASEVGLHSLMVVPLRARGRTLGALSFGAGRTRGSYTADDLALAEELARRASLAIDNARLHQRTRQAVGAREQVLRVVSHDLRNPLSTIVLNASSLLEAATDPPLPALTREQASAVLLSAEQMNRLIGDLVDFARIEGGHLSMERVPHPAGALLRHAVRVLQPLAARAQIHLSCSLADGLPTLDVDGDRIFQLLSNLVGNAIRFTPAGGQILLRARTTGDTVEFAVADTGSGIPPRQLTTLFDCFWNGERTPGTGTGLGLAIARGIVEAHGGRIWAESTPGEGSTFFFTLPLPG